MPNGAVIRSSEIGMRDYTNWSVIKIQHDIDVSFLCTMHQIEVDYGFYSVQYHLFKDVYLIAHQP